MKHIEARVLLKNGQYAQVGQLFGKTVNDGVSIQGHKYVMDGTYDVLAINEAINIANNTTDVPLIAQNTGIPLNIIQDVKEHLFVKEHFIPTDKGFSVGRFEKTPEDIALWESAKSGFTSNMVWMVDGNIPMSIPGAQAQTIFENLIKHEYVELKLMEEGLSYRGMLNNSMTAHDFGAHDVSPNMETGQIIDIGIDFNINVNLNNLNTIVIQMIEKLKL